MSANRIKVAVRCRPLLPNEDQSICVAIHDNICSISTGRGEHERNDFTYDSCFPMETTQETLFQEVGMHVMYNAFEGYHATLLAYGQTGSGKSYSVHGTDENPGLLPRLCDAIFEEIESSPSTIRHTVQASYLEIYNERLRDLLQAESSSTPTIRKSVKSQHSTSQANQAGNQNGARTSEERTSNFSTNEERNSSSSPENNAANVPNAAYGFSPSSRKLEITSHPQEGICIPGLSVCQVQCPEDVWRLMEFGNNLRVQASTSMNPVSSRSHAIFTLEFTQTDERNGGSRKSKIHMVDLAGSERQNKAQAVGERLREGCIINQSLSYLGLVICGLSKGATYIPFRNSKLTHFLCEGLGGNSKTGLIATISPSRMNYDETMSTLRFALTCKSVKTKATINHCPYDPTVIQLREEVEDLRTQLHESNVGIPTSFSSDVPMLTRPNFFYRLEMDQETSIGSDETCDIVLPSCCAARICDIRMQNGDIECIPHAKFVRNGKPVGRIKKDSFLLQNKDLLDFGAGATYRFSLGVADRNTIHEELTIGLRDLPSLNREKCANACDTLESVYHVMNVDSARLCALQEFIAAKRPEAQILLVQNIFHKHEPELAVKYGDKIWKESAFRESVEDAHEDPFVKALHEGDVMKAQEILATAQAATAAMEAQVKTQKNKIKSLEALHEQDSQAIHRLSKKFIELRQDAAAEREEFARTQDDLVKTSEEYAQECRMHQGKTSEFEDTLREREESIKTYMNMIDELKVQECEKCCRNITSTNATVGCVGGYVNCSDPMAQWPTHEGRCARRPENIHTRANTGWCELCHTGLRYHNHPHPSTSTPSLSGSPSNSTPTAAPAAMSFSFGIALLEKGEMIEAFTLKSDILKSAFKIVPSNFSDVFITTVFQTIISIARLLFFVVGYMCAHHQHTEATTHHSVKPKKHKFL